MPGVEAILCDRSALDFWRGESVGEGQTMGYRAALPERRGVVAHDPPSAATVEELRTWGLVGATDDVHLLVTSHDARRRVKGLVLHEVTGPLPKDSIVRAKGTAYAVCPGLLFVMLAARLPLVELLEVGYELCGSYRLGGEVPSYGLAPLTSASELRGYAQRAKGVRGREAALRAAQWLVDGSGSPAETALAIAFALPQRLGGCNLGGFELNRELELGEGAARILGRGFVRPDFYWPRARYAAEFDSNAYHLTPDQADYDERRRNAYGAEGVGLSIFRTRHLLEPGLFDQMVGAMRRAMGVRVRGLPDDYDRMHRALLGEAFRYWLDAEDAYDSTEVESRLAAWEGEGAPW